MPKPRLAVVLDAGPGIGLGHLQRMLAVGEELRAAGAQVRLFTNRLTAKTQRRLQRRKFAHTVLGRSLGAEKEYPRWHERLARWRPDAVISDSYRLRPSWFRGLYRRQRSIVIFDGRRAAGPAHLLLNPTRTLPATGGRSLLSGPRFTPVAKYVVARRVRRRPPAAIVRRVLVSLGGGDRCGMTLRLLRWLGRARQGMHVTIIAGPYFPDGEALLREAAAAGGNRLTVRHDVPSLAPFLANTDLAIINAGSTSWEAACLGVPVLQVTMAANQRPVAARMAAAGAGADLGPARRLTAAKFTAAFRGAADDRILRRRMSAAGRRLVDGRGAERLACAIMRQLNA